MTEMEQLDPHTEKLLRPAIKGQGGTSLFQMRRWQMADGTARHGFDSNRERPNVGLAVEYLANFWREIESCATLAWVLSFPSASFQ